MPRPITGIRSNPEEPGQFGEVHMVIEPYEEGMPEPTTYKIGGVDSKMSIKGKEEYDLPWGGKLVFYNCIVGGVTKPVLCRLFERYYGKRKKGR